MTQREYDDTLLSKLLRISSQRAGAALVLTVNGEVDSLTAPKLADALEALFSQTGGPAIVDLSRVEFLGSHGVAVLHNAAVQAERSQRPLRFVVGHAITALRPLQVLGLDRTLRIHATVGQALASLAEPTG